MQCPGTRKAFAASLRAACEHSGFLYLARQGGGGCSGPGVQLELGACAKIIKPTKERPSRVP